MANPKVTFIPHWKVMLLDMSNLHVRTMQDIDHLDTYVRQRLHEYEQERQTSNHAQNLLTCLVNYDEFLVDDAVVTEYVDWVRKICNEKYAHVIRFSLKVNARSRLNGTTSVQVANWRDQSKSMIPGYLNTLQSELSRMHVLGEHIFGEGDMLQGKRGTYLLTEKLSQGTFGLVRKAQVLPESPIKSSSMEFRHSDVAIKCILRSTIELLDMKDFIETEIQVLYKLQGCQHIVQIIEDIQSDETIFIVMEMLSNEGTIGKSLCSMDDSRERFNETDARSVFRQLLKGIEHMHDHNIIHRDLQLANLCFEKETGELKILDFGASTWSIHPETQRPIENTLLCGNIRYCSPEMISQQKYDQGTDIFSAGVILFKLLTGFFPFHFARETLEGQFSLKMERCLESDGNAHPNGRVVIRDMHDDCDMDTICISHDCHDLLLRMLSGDPSERPTIKEVLEHPWLTHI